MAKGRSSFLGPRGQGLLLLMLAQATQTGACLKSSADARNQTADRAAMVQKQIEDRGVKDRRVLAAMRRVKRHLFVPERFRDQAYDDTPLPIGMNQTISQPYIVGLMTEALYLKPTSRVLEVGTGSGYQAAILGEVAREVYSIEIIPELGHRAAELLGKLGYKNIHLRIGDGYKGWPERAPFDAVILTAAPVRLPDPLLAQLKRSGGVLVAPVGPIADQRLIRIIRTPSGFKREHLLDVRFVPMTGQAEGR